MRSLLILLVLGGVAACKQSEPVERADPGLVRISTDRVIRTGPVGEGEWATQATSVLVDAENNADRDLFVTLGGALTDAAGAEVGALRPESLLIPKGGRRTFALVDAQDAPRPAATGARIEVLGAVGPRWTPRTRIHDAHIFDDRGRVMIAASVTNEADRRAVQIVFAGFHDAEGRPMARPFEVLEMGAGVTQTVRFVGPEGAKTAYLFLGDATY